MENIEQIKSKINTEKFAFIWKEPNLHTKAFLNRTTLKAGVIICGIISLLYATGFVLHAIENYSFLFFLGYFSPGVTMIAGTVLLLLSMENLEEKKAHWGYILTAIALWLHVACNALSMVFTLIWSPKYFFSNLFITLTMIVITFGIYGYSAWINYCFSKHLSAGNKDLVEFGRGDGLISREQGPGVTSSAHIESPNVAKVDYQISDIEKQ
jgi:hypothetical protein